MRTTYSYAGIFIFIALHFSIHSSSQTIVSSRMNEVFQQTILVSGPTTSPSGNRLYDPWEVTYGPDDSLWVTEAKGYKVKKIHPDNAGQRTILNLSDAASGGSFTPSSWRRQFSASQNPWPQGGMMGLAIHPDFNHPTTPKKYVYIAYVHQYITPTTTTPLVTNYAGESVNGYVFVTRLVRFFYDGANLVSPVSLCDTIRGSNDHNSGRLIIKPIGGTNYLIYAVGDMGAGQYSNLDRVEKAQFLNSYEGKILRFNLEPDADLGTYDQWIPNDNPYNGTLGVQSAVWSTGMRNNQGFAYNSENDKLYGGAHGAFSDDEINVIEEGKNYGHPLIIGYSADGNYNNAKAGPSGGSLPLIVSESANATSIGSSYKDPVYSFYPVPAGDNSTLWSIQYIYSNQNYTGSPGPTGSALNVNIHWKSEAISGIDHYNNAFIPGWKNSLLSAALKGGRIIRLKLDPTGETTIPTDGADTVTYFRSVNRFRDLAISPNGKNIFAVIDSSSTTSGPTTSSPMISACRSCLIKYSFLGYNDNSGLSTISTSIPIAPGKNNSITNGTGTTIDATNNNLWVPITDSLGNVIAEIKANGNNLGSITSTLYKNSGPARTVASGKPYLNRSLTISPQNQPSSNVKVRIYLTAAELSALIAESGSGVAGISDIKLFKNNDAVSTAITNSTTTIVPDTAFAFGSGYVVTVSIGSFSSLYFAGELTTLPVNLITFSGNYNNHVSNLHWVTENETNFSRFIVERSTDGINFQSIGTIIGGGNSSSLKQYNLTDKDPSLQSFKKVYYKLRMVNLDNSYKYSPVVTLSPSSNNGKVTIIPNPIVSGSDAKINLSALSDGKINWKVMDIYGRVVLKNSIQVNKGNNSFSINSASLASGIYILDVSGAGIRQKTKFQKL